MKTTTEPQNHSHKKTRLLLVRHASTGAAYQGCLVGKTDIDADPISLAQVTRLNDLLVSHSPVSYYSSPLRRTQQTAAELDKAAQVTRDWQVESNLREIDFGRWEGKRPQVISQEEPNLIEAWSEFDHFQFPEGEAVPLFVNRVRTQLQRFHTSPSTCTLAVTHGGFIRILICLALGLPLRHYLLFQVQPASLTIIDYYDTGGVLVGLNL